ncbi:DUF1310 family protein [Streptococcus suis]
MKKVMKVIIGILLVIGIGIGGIGYMQHKEHEKMVAIATSEEARKVYEDFMKNILRLVVRKSPTGESTHYFFFMIK